MVLFNYSTRELTAKIVYYGPGLCGKTTNLQYIYDSLPDNIKKGKMLSLATKTDRTLFFDFLPIELGTIRGMKTRVQLYTVPGQVFYNSTRKLVLKGADGVVFVADSQSKMLEADTESYKNLEDNLREMGIRLEEIPLVMQFNKRDLPHLSSIEEMNTTINRHNAPFYEAVATTGIGVEDTLKAITKLVLSNLATKYKLEGAVAEQGPPATAPRPVSVPRPVPIPARAPAPRSAVAPPEDLALDALEIEEEPAAPAPVPRRALFERAPARAPAPPPRESDEIFDLGEEIELQAPGEAQDGSVDLGEDLIQELEEEPLPPQPRPAQTSGRAAPPVASRSPSLRAVSSRGLADAEQTLDLDEPIDLGDEVGQALGSGSHRIDSSAIDIGVLVPGQDRAVDLPVTATVNGKPLRLTLRVTVRLSR